jgi:hypothetical protein
VRLSALDPFVAGRYRVYDHVQRRIRNDICWVDSDTAQVGVGYAFMGKEFILRTEQRKTVLIIQSLFWIAVDLPMNDTKLFIYDSLPESLTHPRRELAEVLMRRLKG